MSLMGRVATVSPSTIVLLAERLARHAEPVIRDVREGALSPDFPVPAQLRASLRLRPDPERAGRLERAVTAGDGVLRPGLAWPGLAAIGCWKGGTVGSYLANHVLEFSPAEDGEPQGRDLLPVEGLEVGQRHFVYVTNASGLYRYEMNDIVEVAGMYRQTPLIRFIQKGKGVVSIAGEKLSEVQVIAAVDEALASLRGRYQFIAAVAEMVDPTTPRLVFLVEFDDPITDHDGSVLVDRVDAGLGDHNLEYHRKRVSLRYGAPVIRVVRNGEFDRYRRHMVETGQRADGQFKVLRLTSDPSFAAEFAADRDLVGGQRTSA